MIISGRRALWKNTIVLKRNKNRKEFGIATQCYNRYEGNDAIQIIILYIAKKHMKEYNRG